MLLQIIKDLWSKNDYKASVCEFDTANVCYNFVHVDVDNQIMLQFGSFLRYRVPMSSVPCHSCAWHCFLSTKFRILLRAFVRGSCRRA